METIDPDGSVGVETSAGWVDMRVLECPRCDSFFATEREPIEVDRKVWCPVCKSRIKIREREL